MRLSTIFSDRGMESPRTWDFLGFWAFCAPRIFGEEDLCCAGL